MPAWRIRGKHRAVAVVVAIAVLAAAVLAGAWQLTRGAEQAPPTAQADGADPAPGAMRSIGTLSPDGGSIAAGSVMVSAAAGVVSSGDVLDVAVGREASRTGLEVFGQPVAGSHRADLDGTVTIRWSGVGLSEAQLATVVPAQWDPDLQVWRLQPSVEPVIEGGDVVLDVPHFSIWSWIANAGDDVSQTLGEVTGSRVDAPSCTGAGLPAWVRQAVDPDDDSPAAAIRVCFEPDGDRVTVRVANNRTFTQQMAVRNAAAEWAWTWEGERGFGMQQALYDTARKVFDDTSHYLLPPTHTVAVGVGRPAAGAASLIEVPSNVNGVTIAVDVSAWMLDQVPIGGLDNPYANAFIQMLFECGGKQIVDAGGTPDALLPAVVDALGGCAEEIMRPDSEFGQRMEDLARAKIQATGSASAVRSYRLVGEVAQAFKVLTAAKVGFYLSDQLANAMVGPLLWSIRGTGQPQVLGQWTPTCTDLASDSNRLYLNLALQEEFSDTSRELHEFEGWADAAAAAVEPLTECPEEYRRQLAGYLPGNWGDPQAAQVVADAILVGLAANGAAGSLALTASGLGPLRFGATIPEAEATGLITWDEDFCSAEIYGRDYGSFVVDSGRFPLGEPNIMGLNEFFGAFDVGVHPDTQRVSRIDVFSASVPTGEGVRVGDSVAKLRQTYGGALVEGSPGYPGADAYVLWINRGPVDLVFDVFTGSGEPVIWRLSLVEASAEHVSTISSDDTAGGC